MQPQLLFVIVITLNLIGAASMMAVIGVVLCLSWRTRLNRLLAFYVSICLLWTLAALSGRLLMTANFVSVTAGDEKTISTLVYIILIAITGNGTFLFAFVNEYIGKWHDERLRLMRWGAFALTALNAVSLYVYTPRYISDYILSFTGMSTIEPSNFALVMLGLSYFSWYGASLYLLWKHRQPQTKWVFWGVIAIAAGLAIELVTPAGHVLPIAVMMTGIGTIAFAYSVWQDNIFSPMMRQNSKLEQSSKNMQQIIAAIPFCVIITDAKGIIKFANEMSVDIYGYTPAELRGVQIATLYNSQEDRQKVLDSIANTGRMLDYELYYKHRFNKTRLTRVQIVRIMYDGDDANLGIVQDIQEQRKVEASLQQMQKWESLAVLAGGIAHDFNNLLVAMLGQSSVAKAKMREEDSAYKHIVKVENAARRASILTHQMLAYSGRGTFTTRPLNINTVFRENLSLLDVSIPQDVALVAELDEQLPLVMADPAQMQQVIMNLIINAAEAVEAHDGTITVETGTCIDPSLTDGHWMQPAPDKLYGTYVSLSVTDNGTGIERAQLNQIFDPFFSTKDRGSGLGLAAVVGIMRGHKGAIQVTSEVGEGTRFFLLLPASPIASDDDADMVVLDSAEPILQ